MNNQKFFILNSECFLVKGAKRGAIYDLRGEDIYSIDEASASILENLEKSQKIKSFALCASFLKLKKIPINNKGKNNNETKNCIIKLALYPMLNILKV